ncbi:hypothetical protein [Sorangium sp. So ce1024]|uniref:hypothetical protein n=1 Tax=Sorangium sp. So ce1024 TaxID=3133327 RepID=UPI003F079669
MSTFRLAAHRRLVTDPRRGRLLLQLAFVADKEAEAIWDPYAWPPVRFDALSPEQRAEYDRLQALGAALYADAAKLGVRGGTDEAFRAVFAAAAPLFEAAARRENLAWDVAEALEAGAILSAGDVEVGPVSSRRGLPLFEATRGGVALNVSLSAESAAAAFCGERGAGVEAARAALEAWERREEERAA